MKFVSLISSGIDSPVATYLISKKADEIILLHAEGTPYYDENDTEYFLVLVKHLKNIIDVKTKIFIIPHGEALSSYIRSAHPRYTCVFCKRMLVRYAEKIAEKEGFDAIVMGDSLGQVASQTLKNIRVVEQAVKIPILRPLIGLDKQEIVNISREIGTYDLSTASNTGCSAVPHKPATRAKLQDVLREEEKIDVNKLIMNAINNIKLINI